MKIITNDAAYVQKNDLNFLHLSDVPKTSSIYLSVFDWGKTRITDKNKNEFYRFENEEDIEYFKKLDWMVDYDEIKNLSDAELVKMGQSISIEKNRIGEVFNDMSIKERMNNTDMVLRHKVLEFKMKSLIDVILYKRGELSFELPEGFEIKRNEVGEDSADINKK